MTPVHFLMVAGVAALSFALCSCADDEPTSANNAMSAFENMADGSDESDNADEGSPPQSDALVPGTPYHATTDINCVFGEMPHTTCPAGVICQWGEDGTTLVEVTKPDGFKRALFFKDGVAYGADSAESDGSAGFEFKLERQGDDSIITYGPEQYVIPDALVMGG